MNSIAHFDPANLAIWIDLRALYEGHHIQSKLVGNAPVYSRSAVASARKPLSEWDEKFFDRDHRVHQTARLWGTLNHEKRHFLDTIFTTHGYWLQRQFNAVHGAGLLYNAELTSGAVGLPIGADSTPRFADKTNRSGYERLVKNLDFRRGFEREDNTPFEGSPIPTGGRSIREWLAFASEINHLEEIYGTATKNFADGFNHLYGDGFSDPIYTAVLHFDRLLRGDKNIEFDRPIDTSLSGPLLFAALNPDFWCEEEKVSGYSMPKLRLDELFSEASKDKPELREYDAQYGWDYAQKLVVRLYGESTLQTIERDIDRQCAFVEKFESAFADLEANVGMKHPALVAATDALRLRQTLLSAFKNDPLQFVDPRVYATRLAPKLHPPIIWCDSLGMDFEGDHELRPIVYTTNKDDRDRGLVYARLDMDSFDRPGFALREGEAWFNMAIVFSRFAKLAVGGLQYPAVVGLELVQALQNFEAGFPNRFYVSRRYDYRRSGPAWDELWSFHSREGAFCDLCNNRLSKESYRSLSGYAFHLDSEVRAKVLSRLDPLTSSLLAIDWGNWKFCATCYERLNL